MSYTWTNGEPSDGTEVAVSASRQYNHGQPENYEDFYQVNLQFTGEAVGQHGYSGPQTKEIAEALHETFTALGFEDVRVTFRVPGSSKLVEGE